MIKEKFYIEKKYKTFRRIDEKHPLDIFVGYNEKGNPSIIISIVGKERMIQSTQSIKVSTFKIESKIRILFSLLDKNKETIFYKFCEDIVESTRNIDEKKVFEFIIYRWNEWRFMFKKPNIELLTENQIVGLLGELLFLDNYMFSRYGIEKSIKAWQGPTKSHKDFEIKNTWYEVKTIRQSVLTVKISSIEQLDSNLDGNLEVITLERANEEVENSISINKIIQYLSEKINSFEIYNMFYEKLAQIGYFYDEEYDKYVYKYIKRDTYLVDKNFPRIKRDSLEEGIVNISYDILLREIEKLKR